MPADEFTATHFKAIKACLEVAEPSKNDEEPLYDIAMEGLNILLQHNPELEYTDPFDQLTVSDKHLLTEYTHAAQVMYWDQDQGSSDSAEKSEKVFSSWQQVMIERLNRDSYRQVDNSPKVG